MVPEVGVEPTRAQGPLDFESSASTSFTTPALRMAFDRNIFNIFRRLSEKEPHRSRMSLTSPGGGMENGCSRRGSSALLMLLYQ